MASTPSPTASSPKQESSLPPTSPVDPVGPQPTQPAPQIDVVKFRETDDGKALAAWVRTEFDKAKTARKQKETAWYVNMSMVMGNQWIRRMPKGTPDGFDQKLLRDPSNSGERRTINRAQAFVRWELSKYTSKQPTIVAVPGSGEDGDVRAAYAAEQAWESVSSAQNLRRHFTRSAWWFSVTGNGFVKTEWDPYSTAADGQPGDIRFSNITPFHLFVPDLREVEIENQPYITFAYTKTVAWVMSIYADVLKDVTLKGSSDSSASLIDEAYLNLQKSTSNDCVIIREMWVKPGAHRLFPNGGLVIMVEDTLLGVWLDEFPYAHGHFPVTHFGHLDTGGFYCDSPLRDLNQLQREYNAIRTRLSEAARRMASPQIIAPMGSIVPSKISNEIGQIITYRPGLGVPQPMPLQNIPAYVLQQQDRIMQDWEDISGIRDVTTGNAPAGVSAGTALNYLQEAANSFHTPQFQEIEFGHENIAKQTLALFQQYVDYPRAIKVIGADQAYDTMTLQGADISGGLDVRVEANSAAPVSQAANQAKVMDMFSMGMIDQGMALKMMDVGGFQRMMSIVQVAERKAQRENQQIKKLDPVDIENAQMQQQQAFEQQIAEQPALLQDPEVQQMAQGGMTAPLLIQVDDFDDHPTHIAIHNAFRMGQEYALLDPSVQQQFAMHVALHQRYLQQQQMQQFLSTIPQGDGDMSGGEEKPPAGGPGGGEEPGGSMPPTPGGSNG